jgi:hypothetical protein
LNKLNKITLAGFASLLAFSCTNGASIVSHGSSNSSATLSSGGDSLTSGTVPVVTRVIIDPVNPGTFDLEGDGSNSIGQDCVATSTGTTTSTSSTNLEGTGTSTCQCFYQYTRASGTQESVYVNTSYFEANMVRCPYTTIESDVTSVNVSLFDTTSGQASSPAIPVPLTGAASGFDLTNINNFLNMQRWQCKDVVTIYSPWSGTGSSGAGSNAMYDPVQSDDPDMSYPLNFYTGNFGAAFSYFSSGSPSTLQNWNCPTIPNNPNLPGYDLRVWSVGPDTAGSSNIYPPTGSAFDRSTFYVAKQAAGIFNVPLNTYIAPTLYGQVGGTGSSAPSGYGVSPTFVSSTQETCGDGTTTNIPAGYQWAKLWLFRADLADRYYRTSSAIGSVSINCNPGPDTSNNSPFTNCYPAGGGTGTTYLTSATVHNAPVPLADRIIYGEGETSPYINIACVNFDGSGVGLGYSTCLNSSKEAPGCWTGTETTAQFGAGTDYWSLIGSYPTPYNDPIGIIAPGIPGQHVPKDLNPTSTDLDANTSGTPNARYDFLFVVTPVTVMAYQMENTASSLNYPYTPYRFPSKQDCQSSNPNNPAFSGDCNPSKIIHYGLKLHDISTNGDPGNNTSNLVYPMCVLQPI